VSLLACGLGVGCWALAGRLLARALAQPARQRWFNRAMGALLALSVASMLG
jgi:threonine/homoserine/homoserine lactone efflux protein